MNYIKQLQCDVIERDRVILERMERMQEFRKHIMSDKFRNTDTERNDWISTADVQRWLTYIEDDIEV